MHFRTFLCRFLGDGHIKMFFVTELYALLRKFLLFVLLLRAAGAYKLW
jgi:hypothetical protein